MMNPTGKKSMLLGIMLLFHKASLISIHDSKQFYNCFVNIKIVEDLSKLLILIEDLSKFQILIIFSHKRGFFIIML